MSDKPSTAMCNLHEEPVILPSPKETYIVDRRQSVPKGAEDLAAVIGQSVCEDCCRVLRTAGFRVFNLQAAREKRDQKQQAARATIADILRSKGQSITVKVAESA